MCIRDRSCAFLVTQTGPEACPTASASSSPFSRCRTLVANRAACGSCVTITTVLPLSLIHIWLTFIGTDNYKAGLMGAQLAVKQLQGKGNVLIFTMPEQANLKERLHGYHDGFEGHPGIKIVETVDIKGDARIAFDHTQELVDKKGMDKVDGFICLEAIACPEVADVLDRNKVGGKVVVAMDTDQRTLDAIKNNRIAGTIAQKPFTMGFVGLPALDTLHHYPCLLYTSPFCSMHP